MLLFVNGFVEVIVFFYDLFEDDMDISDDEYGYYYVWYDEDMYFEVGERLLDLEYIFWEELLVVNVICDYLFLFMVIEEDLFFFSDSDEEFIFFIGLYYRNGVMELFVLIIYDVVYDCDMNLYDQQIVYVIGIYVEIVLYDDDDVEEYVFLVEFEVLFVLVLNIYYEDYFLLVVVYEKILLFSGDVELYDILELEDILLVEGNSCEFFFIVVESIEFIFCDFYVVDKGVGEFFVGYNEFDILNVFKDYVIISEEFYVKFEVYVFNVDVFVELLYFVERLLLFLVMGSFVDIGSIELVLVYEDFFLLDELFFDKF